MWPLVGREVEVRVLRQLLREPDSGGVVIAGAVGTGKTRLALEALALAERDRMPTQRIVGSRAAASIPLGVFASMLPPLAARAPTIELLRLGLDALAARASTRGRLTLMVDDAHLLDDASATLVHQAVAGGHVVVVATVRTDEAAPDAVVALWKDRLTKRLELQDLSQEETDALLHQALGGEVDPATSYRLWELAGGNPLFLRELVTGARNSGALESTGGAWVLREPVSAPASLREIVHARLADVPADALGALRTLAVAERLGARKLASLHGPDALELIESLGLIEIAVSERRRTASLSHPLYGEVLLADLPATAVGRVAAGLAQQLREVGTRRRDDLLRLVTYELAAGVVPDAEQLRPAALHAYQAGDFTVAERLARLAPAADAESRLLLAQVLDESGRQEEAAEVVETLPLERLEPALRLSAALVASDACYFGLGSEHRAFAILRDTIEALAGRHEVGELIANRGWLELHSGRPGEALATVAELQDSRDPLVRAAGAIVTSRALGLVGQTGAALACADRALPPDDEARPLAVSRHSEFPVLVRGYALLYSGALDEADAVAIRGLQSVLAGRPTFLRAQWLSFLGWVRHARGEMESAAGYFQQAAALQLHLSQTGLLRWDLAGLALARAQAGQTEQAAATLAEHDRLGERPEQLLASEVARARAWTLAGAGQFGDALRELTTGADRARSLGAVTLEAACLHDLARLGDAAVAASRLAELDDDSALTAARRRHADALAAGDADGLADAAGRFETLGALLLAAEAHTAAARAHRRSARSRVAQRHRVRAAELVARCGQVRTPALAIDEEVTPLTPREREVVTMAAGGLTSREIAAQLVVSVRTVDNLLHRAYGKLGVHDRREAAVALGLSPSGPATTDRTTIGQP